ncbi:MAG: 30S ribosomal protein S6 [Patescibacteria group bacterium]
MKATEHKETGEKMHIYEVSYLVVPTVSEDKVTGEVSAIRGALEGAGAVIIAEEFPKTRTLAYTMERSIESKKQKFNEGYFGWIKFELSVASISNIKQKIDKMPNILRHLIIKTVRENALYSSKSAGVHSKNGDKPEGETRGEIISEVAGKEIDKSIDALVIN